AGGGHPVRLRPNDVPSPGRAPRDGAPGRGRPVGDHHAGGGARVRRRRGERAEIDGRRRHGTGAHVRPALRARARSARDAELARHRDHALQNNIVVVPNQQVARSVITNYDLPEPRMALPLRVSVAYGTDPDLVEQALLDEASRAVGEIPGLLAEPKPGVRLIPGFGESSLDFTLVCHVA